MLIQPPHFDRLFLHFFDIHFLEMIGYNRESAQVRTFIQNECNIATRLAILAADEVLIPAASYFESDMCFEILHHLRGLYEYNQLRLVGGGMNLDEFADEKLEQYRSNAFQFVRYSALKKRLPSHPPFLPRTESSSRDIVTGWNHIVKVGNVNRVLGGPQISLPKDLEESWEKVPNRLGKRAFIVDYVVPLLFRHSQPAPIRNRLHGVINEQYFGSYTREFNAGIVVELNYLDPRCVIPSYGTDLPYKHFAAELRRRGLLQEAVRADAQCLVGMKERPELREALSGAILRYKPRRVAVAMQSNIPVMSTLYSARIGILTALPKEFEAVCDVFNCEERVVAPGEGAGRKYAIAKVGTLPGHESIVAVAMLCGPGNNLAAIRATEMFFHCPQVRLLIMVGIAGAVPNPSNPDEHVRLGDIVVSGSSGIVQYDRGKQTPDQFVDAIPPRPPDANFLNATLDLMVRSELPWEADIDQGIRGHEERRRPKDNADILYDARSRSKIIKHPVDPQRRKGYPRVFIGGIGSANIVLKDPIRRDALRAKYGIRAVEMEASGAADAAWNRGIGYGVVRGTCDYCDTHKNDIWHEYAALIAAAYTRAIVESVIPKVQDNVVVDAFNR